MRVEIKKLRAMRWFKRACPTNGWLPYSRSNLCSHIIDLPAQNAHEAISACAQPFDDLTWISE